MLFQVLPFLNLRWLSVFRPKQLVVQILQLLVLPFLFFGWCCAFSVSEGFCGKREPRSVAAQLSEMEQDEEYSGSEEEFEEGDNNEANDKTEADVGIIEEITLHNFMCHKNLNIKLGPHINFIVVQNGSKI